MVADSVDDVDFPALVPASLLPGRAAVRSGRWSRRRTVHRSGRDWLVDVLVFVLAAGLGGLFVYSALQSEEESATTLELVVDLALGGLSCCALWLRRRWPVGITVAIGLVVVVSASAVMASVVAVFTVAVHRRAKVLAGVITLHLCASVGYGLYRPSADSPVWVDLFFTTLILSVVAAWGMLVRARRQLVLSLRERAERAEATQRLRAEQARSAERARIAREMHDVLAHRITMVALHAGALEISSDLPSEQVGATAGVIRGAARQALEELREVIGVLRSDNRGGPETAPRVPQPTLADVSRLVAEARHAGLRVETSIDVKSPDTAPGSLGRDAYRIVQEALTNVGKHAPRVVATVSLVGRPGEGLRVLVSNELPAPALRTPLAFTAPSPSALAPSEPSASGLSASGLSPSRLSASGPGTSPASSTSASATEAVDPTVTPALPGAGAGLTGLAERVSLSGGTLTCGPTAEGTFVVDARLRWPR
ncbi:Signal transduction histidine kinase [Parafrankia irregularis]|uniref:histidine kinase n=1 Tax=Parafrankia irregularis TaxID=795642 RepID=A0A0S4QX13_9ACTN|nr:histidine kinase [Parafrankia irregularis]MBE3201526.1 sensor histidine kinase [Parafrankia sp. CH37]CUU59404.1 Signal transduction histidine kinase [Parafrankia irregularis]